MDAQALAVGGLADRPRLGHGQAAAAGDIVGIFQADQRQSRAEDAGRANRRQHLLGRDERAVHQGRQQPGDGGHAAALVEIDVAIVGEQHRVAPRRAGEQAEQVAHRAAQHQHRRRLAEQGSRLLLEPAHRRIVAVEIVADLGFRHGSAHRRRRSRHGIAAQVDRLHVSSGRGGRPRA
jgi:hypothetical protein